MNGDKLKYAVGWLLSFALGIVFLLAGWSKVTDPAAFMGILEKLAPAPWLRDSLFYITPGIELTLGIAFVTLRWRREAAVIAIPLCLLFLALGVYLNLTGNEFAKCGCFSPEVAPWFQTSGWGTVLRDLGFLSAALLVYISSRNPERISKSSYPSKI